MSRQAEPTSPALDSGGPGGKSGRASLLVSHIDRVWPASVRPREIAGLPRAVADAVRPGARRGPFSRAAAMLDGLLPGWTETAVELICERARAECDTEVQRACSLLAYRPLADPARLISALDGCAADSEACFWLLAALAGTDTAAVRLAWLDCLRRWACVEAPRSARVGWLAFVRALAGGWLRWSDFRQCVTRAGVLDAACSGLDYRRPLERLGLWSHAQFAKWYCQAVYETAHQPDVSLSLRAGGWIRDFPGSSYLWDALAELGERPNHWWALYVLRWASGAEPGSEESARRLREVAPHATCLLSIVRPEWRAAAGEALGAPQHADAVGWLGTTSPATPLDVRWIENTLAPWAQSVGEPFTVAVGALCSIDAPEDFEGPVAPGPRRRAFVSDWLVPEFDRFVDNLFYVHALLRRNFPAMCRHAARGGASALRALALWPERAAEAAPVLFAALRAGNAESRAAAREALRLLGARIGVSDLHGLEKRVDLASAWADAGLDGRPSRVWWDVAGHRVKLSVADGKVSLQTYSGTRRLSSVPAAVRRHELYAEIKQTRAELARSYRYFRRRFEQAMVEGTAYTGRDWQALLANPIVRSLASRLVLTVDGQPTHWMPPDALDECRPPEEIGRAERVCIAHPVELAGRGELETWQRLMTERRVPQPFKQVFREVYWLGEAEREGRECARFAGHRVSARRAFALLRARGYSPRQGDAAKEWPCSGVRAHLRWAAPEEHAGRLLTADGEADAVTTGPVWFTDAVGDGVPLRAVSPVVVSETLRDADLVVSLAAAGELGFSSEETLRMRAAIVRYLARALGITTVYVSEDSAHAIVEGSRAMYRVHLGSGSVLVEATRRHLDVGAVCSDALRALVAEGLDSRTSQIIGVIGALTQDDRITDPVFLNQLGPGAGP